MISLFWPEAVGYQLGDPERDPKVVERAARAATAMAGRMAKEDRSRTFRLMAALLLKGYTPARVYEAVRTDWADSGELPRRGYDAF